MIYLTVALLGLVLAGLIGLGWRQLTSADRWFGALVIAFIGLVLLADMSRWQPDLARWTYLGSTIVLVTTGLALLARARNGSGVRLAVLMIGTFLASLPALMLLLYAYAMAH